MYKKFKLDMPNFKVRKHWLNLLIECEDYFRKVFRLINSYASTLKRNSGYFAVEYVNDIIVHVLELVHMLGFVCNWKFEYNENTVLGAILNAFNDVERPTNELVKRIMRGFKDEEND